MQHADVIKPGSDPVDVACNLLGKRPDHVLRAGNGGNSRIYRVDAGGEFYALKMYPTLARDPRDRQGVEKQALRFFEQNGITCVPRWLNDCPGYGLLTWIDGTSANPPTDNELKKAVAFLADIKRLSELPSAYALPPASEACGSGMEVVRQIERRLTHLQDAAKNEPALDAFLGDTFIPVLKTHRNTAGLPAGKPCLIPADFGFHNAMRGAGDTLTFIDFEYFGWDDPVKLTADFLLHPGMSLTPSQHARFHTAMLALFADDAGFAVRLQALTPLFALRWTLILLNEFLPERWSGRAFAQGSSEWATAKTRQLAKAEIMLEKKAL